MGDLSTVVIRLGFVLLFWMRLRKRRYFVNGVIRMLITCAFDREAQYGLWGFTVGLAFPTDPILGSIGLSNEC